MFVESASWNLRKSSTCLRRGGRSFEGGSVRGGKVCPGSREPMRPRAVALLRDFW